VPSPQYPWWNPPGWFFDTPATPQDFAEARDKVANYYRDLGYLDVSVSLPEAVPVEGSSNKDIAAKLFISENTVKFHIRNLLKKTGCANRSGLISLFNSKSTTHHLG
jgi:FixJ family two-component response regulator